MFRAGVITMLAVVAVHVVPAAANAPSTFNPVVEAQNFSITQQRQAIYDTPQYQAQLAADGAASRRRRWPHRPPIPDGSSPTTCAGTSVTGAPAISG